MHVTIAPATLEDAPDIAQFVGDLLSEIMSTIGLAAFHFDLQETKVRFCDFIANQRYFVWKATNELGQMVGFLNAYEGYALYTEGAFATITELYVKPDYRSRGVGKQLLDAVQDFGKLQGWKRLEVTTPPLPAFDATLSFYEREGFEVTGGRKLKILL